MLLRAPADGDPPIASAASHELPCCRPTHRCKGILAARPPKRPAGAVARYARESSFPYLDARGGFQHAVIEYARNVLGWMDTDHAESSPNAGSAVTSALECALVEASRRVRPLPGIGTGRAGGALEAEAQYRRRYGLSPCVRQQVPGGALCASAQDAAAAVRAIELDGRPFLVAPLFQPERAALRAAPVAPTATRVRTWLARAG